MQLAVIGGDQRQCFMARWLAGVGHRMTAWGIGAFSDQPSGVIACADWEDAVRSSEVVILPMPISFDGVRVYSHLQENEGLRLSTLMDRIKGRILLGGRFTEKIARLAEQKEIRIIDYYDCEILKLKNALLTAEGAISIAMQALSVTLDGSRAAVLGYGRIGSLLAEKLYGLGMSVTVYARSMEQLTSASLHHHSVCQLSVDELGNTTADAIKGDYRVVFNTIPHRILDHETLKRFEKNCVLIDLASAPGGIDHNAASELGLKSIWGTALPGRYTPESAGIILGEVIDGILSKIC